jgi:uncharacterized protein involved in exopolysaccharide biosynthesis
MRFSSLPFRLAVVLLRYRRLVLLSTAIGVATRVLAALLSPNEYVAESAYLPRLPP